MEKHKALLYTSHDFVFKAICSFDSIVSQSGEERFSTYVVITAFVNVNHHAQCPYKCKQQQESPVSPHLPILIVME